MALLNCKAKLWYLIFTSNSYIWLLLFLIVYQFNSWIHEFITLLLKLCGAERHFNTGVHYCLDGQTLDFYSNVN